MGAPQLNESALLKRLLSHTSEAFALLSDAGVILQANDLFSSLSGIEQDALPGADFFELLDESSHSSVKEVLQNLSYPNSNEIDMRFATPEGSSRHLQGRMFRVGEGGKQVGLLFKDISDVEREHEQYRLISDALMAAANAVVICDSKGIILKVNPAFTTFTGYSAMEAVGQSTALLRSGKHTDEFYQKMWGTISRGDVWQGEITNKKKDGSLYTEEMTITPVFSRAGDIKNFIAIKQDITERKRLEEMYLRAQRLESVGTIASGVAHDLNNVLSPIIMSADLLIAQNKGKDDPNVELYQMIKGGAKRGADIVRQLLGFARGGGDEFVETQVRHLLKEQIKIFRSTFSKKVTIESNLDPNLRTISGNTTRLIQVFTNLMINARDAMPEGGNLLVEATNQTIDHAFADEHPSAEPGDVIRVRIQDNGMGMSEETQAKIFDSFFTTKEKGKGTGLGLPTAMSIIREHSGFLCMTSELDVGTTFDVYLPVSHAAGEVQVEKERGSPVYGNGEVVLVVDDEESIGFMLKSTLQSLGYEVVFKNGGQQGIDWISENPNKTDLLLLDLMMPDVDGAEVLSALRKVNLLPTTLVMSGMISENGMEGLKLETGDHFISKPFTIREVSEKIDSLLKNKNG